MARMRVVLYSEQYAAVEVEADPNADDAELTQLALAQLDASGGAEWVGAGGWVEERVVLADGQDAADYVPPWQRPRPRRNP